MSVIQEVYVESVWEEAEVVRQRRDERYAELQAAGMKCQRQDLYTVDLWRVFVVTATSTEMLFPTLSRQMKYERSQSGRRFEAHEARLPDLPRPRADRPRQSSRRYVER